MLASACPDGDESVGFLPFGVASESVFVCSSLYTVRRPAPPCTTPRAPPTLKPR